LSSLSDDELNDRIIQLYGYLPSEEELSESIKELRQELNAEKC
jgi:ribosomal protein L29